MAKIEKLLLFIEQWEGGYVNDPNDLGGATNKGVTLKTWQSVGYDKNGDGKIDEEDLKRITSQDLVTVVLRPYYWNRCQGDRIQSQAIANIFVDWAWLTGVITIKFTQKIVGVKEDGIVGEQTLRAINEADEKQLFERIKAERIAHIEQICKARPANNRFKKGWLNRIAAHRIN